MARTFRKIKPGRIKMLMTASYLLLLVFGMLWLRTQYRQEENGLRQELAQLFDQVQQGISDSLVLVSVAGPAEAMEAAAPAQPLSLNEDTLNRLGALLQQGSQAGVSPRGLRMALGKVRQLSPTEKQYLFHIDTTVFNSEFSERMKRRGWNFPVRWTLASTGRGSDAIFIANRYFRSGYGVLISRYQDYLLGKLWPQAAFVLVLLGVTMLALVTTYRSLLRQVQLSTMKDDFVSNISHELKTPIATIKVALEAIPHFDAAGQKELTAEYMHMAGLELERLELLVNRSLHTSLLESGRLSIQPELQDLEEIIGEVLRAYQVKFVSYDAAVHFEARGRHFKALVDKLHLQGVLVNLLDNSLKYGEGPVAIRVLLEEQDDHLYISVTDNGPGIPEAYRHKVFEKFFRVPAGNRHEVKGYGLGLSYAAQVMAQHRGHIAVANVPGGGCCFTLSLN